MERKRREGGEEGGGGGKGGLIRKGRGTGVDLEESIFGKRCDLKKIFRRGVLIETWVMPL